MYNDQKLVEAAVKFREAANELSRQWEHADDSSVAVKTLNSNYPPQWPSFDGLAMQVDIWLNKIEMNTQRKQRLLEAAKWHQQNDKNSDFDEAAEEYLNGELSEESFVELLINRFETIRDYEVAETDVDDIRKMNDWIEYIKE